MAETGNNTLTENPIVLIKTEDIERLENPTVLIKTEGIERLEKPTVLIKTEHTDGSEDKASQTPILDKLFHCCECGLDVSTKRELMTHFRQHPGLRTCRCNVCQKEYNTCAKLHLHINSHLGRKDYTCDICGKNFARKSGLRRHFAKAHASNKPHTFVVGGTSNPAELEKHLIVSATDPEVEIYEQYEISLDSIIQ
ncbi:zinc finger protein 155-like [Gigantopelta aegis]|uniref:zinc finger protein 155-like n=1 Tax=Gigantopelta aegis TaxID=1735272 RepID=UPI001B88C9A1|nr:zinc finger protein 155-like [Gigantopelta aegis]XP_041355680.1 zinc finger protein 155-like [Gigantopelta aegis]XP_041355681.1 zinc finger protein 155-like [Gigantopelta aegis]